MPVVLSYSGLRAPQFLWAIPNSKEHRLAKPLSRTHMAVGFQRRGGFDPPLKGRLRRRRRPRQLTDRIAVSLRGFAVSTLPKRPTRLVFSPSRWTRLPKG